MGTAGIDWCIILQVEEDRSLLPPPRKKRISQADVLEEQHKALKLQQEMLELKKKKVRMEILLIGKELDDADKENLPNWIKFIYHEHCNFSWTYTVI